MGTGGASAPGAAATPQNAHPILHFHTPDIPSRSPHTRGRPTTRDSLAREPPAEEVRCPLWLALLHGTTIGSSGSSNAAVHWSSNQYHSSEAHTGVHQGSAAQTCHSITRVSKRVSIMGTLTKELLATLSKLRQSLIKDMAVTKIPMRFGGSNTQKL